MNVLSSIILTVFEFHLVIDILGALKEETETICPLPPA